jgi:hypothetical protein
MEEKQLSLRTQELAAQVVRDAGEQGNHVRFIASVLRACATVLEAEGVRRHPGLSKTGEYSVVIDLEQSPDSEDWRAA